MPAMASLLSNAGAEWKPWVQLSERCEGVETWKRLRLGQRSTPSTPLGERFNVEVQARRASHKQATPSLERRSKAGEDAIVAHALARRCARVQLGVGRSLVVSLPPELGGVALGLRTAADTLNKRPSSWGPHTTTHQARAGARGFGL